MKQEQLDLIFKLKKYIIDIINADNKTFYLLYSEIRLFLHSDKVISYVLHDCVNNYINQLYDLNYKKYLNSSILSVNLLNKYLEKYLTEKLNTFDEVIEVPFKYFIHPIFAKLSKFVLGIDYSGQLENFGNSGLFFYYYLLLDLLSKQVKKKNLFIFKRRYEYIQDLSLDKNWIFEEFYIFELYPGFDYIHKGQNLSFLLKIVVISVLNYIVSFIKEGYYKEFSNKQKDEFVDISQKGNKISEKLREILLQRITPAQIEVINLTKKGYTEKEIAKELSITENAVKKRKELIAKTYNDVYNNYEAKIKPKEIIRRIEI